MDKFLTKKRNNESVFALEDEDEIIIPEKIHKNENKIPKILDDEFYKIVSSDPDSETVKAQCLNCAKVLCGSLKSTGNFFSDRIHPTLLNKMRKYVEKKNKTVLCPL